MIPERLRVNEREIRRAVVRRQYRDMTGQLEALRRMADQHILELPEGAPLRLEIAEWMLATIKWARLMLATQRQAWSGELERLPKIGRYLDPTNRRPPGVCLDL